MGTGRLSAAPFAPVALAADVVVEGPDGRPMTLPDTGAIALYGVFACAALLFLFAPHHLAGARFFRSSLQVILAAAAVLGVQIAQIASVLADGMTPGAAGAGLATAVVAAAAAVAWDRRRPSMRLGDEDVAAVRRFLTDTCVLDQPNARTEQRDLDAAYRRWATSHDAPALSSTQLSGALTVLEYATIGRERSASGRLWLGIGQRHDG